MSHGLAASVSPTPRNSSYGELKTQVARYVNLPDDDEALAVAGDAINDAISDINLRFWYWSITFQDIYTSLDLADYTLNSNYDTNFHVELLDDDNGDPNGKLNYYDPKTFLDRYPRATSPGHPQACTVMNYVDTLLFTLNKRPVQAWVDDHPVMRVRYFRKLQRMKGDSDRIVAPSEVELFLKWYAKAEIADVFDARRARRAAIERERIRKALRDKDNEHHFRNWGH